MWAFHRWDSPDSGFGIENPARLGVAALRCWGGRVRRGALGAGGWWRAVAGAGGITGDKAGPGSLGHGHRQERTSSGCLRGGGGTCCAQAFLGGTGSFCGFSSPSGAGASEMTWVRGPAVCAEDPGLVQRGVGLLFAGGKRGDRDGRYTGPGPPWLGSESRRSWR